MASRKLHPDELDIDVSLVRRLLAAQLPQWADLPLRPVVSSGSDNAIYRLGGDMAVRLPLRAGRTEESLDKEAEWLPKLAPLLPLAVPLPLALGAPGEGYPCRWAVYNWLEGEAATVDNLDDPHVAARDLARFLAALQRIDTAGAPSSKRGRSSASRSPASASRSQRRRSARCFPFSLGSGQPSRPRRCRESSHPSRRNCLRRGCGSSNGSCRR